MKKKDDGLNTSEELRLFLEQDLTGDFISTVEGKLITCNKAYLKILGFKSIEKAINFDLIKLYPSPEEHSKIIELLKKNKYLNSYEYQMITCDGNPVYIIANLHGEFDNSGKLIRIRGYLYDNTDREKALDDNKKLARAVEQSPAITIITDPLGNIEYVNSKFTELTGYSKEEVTGKNPRILKSGKTSGEEYKNLWETILSGKQWEGELLNRKKDGTLYWASARITQIENSKNEISHFLALQRDITDQKNAEQIQRVILNISSAANTSYSLEELIENIRKEIGKFIDVSNFYVALYQKDNDTISLAYHSDKQNIKKFPQGNTLIRHIIKTQKPFWGTWKDIIELEKQGAIKFYGEKVEAWIGVPLKVKEETIGAFAIHSHNDKNAFNKEDLDLLDFISNKISQAIERKKNEELLREALEKAQESDRLKSAFLAAMSHELRTPLNAIIGFSDILSKDSSASVKYQEYGKIIQASGYHLLDIIESIFDITRIETGNTKVNKSLFNIDELINKLSNEIQSWREKQRKAHIKFTIKLSDKDFHFPIYTDYEKLYKILINLIKNAFKFTKDGNIEVGYIQQQLDKSMFIEFYVKDTGIGISKEKQEIIFDVFRQVDDSHTREYEGTGAGLSIAKNLVVMLGGNIWVESETGIGSTFYFNIPLEQQKIKTKRNGEKNNTTRTIYFPGKTILIAEDEDSNYQLLKLLISSSQATVLWAKNGKEAVNMCVKSPDIDLVLMDIKMPQMNGFEATRRIKEKCPGIRIIAQTAYTSYDDHEKAKKAGCDGYIEKPIQKGKLFELLTEFLNN